MWTAFYEDTNEILFPLLIEIDVGKLFLAFDVYHHVLSVDCSNESLTSVLHKLIPFKSISSDGWNERKFAEVIANQQSSSKA